MLDLKESVWRLLVRSVGQPYLLAALPPGVPPRPELLPPMPPPGRYRAISKRPLKGGRAHGGVRMGGFRRWCRGGEAGLERLAGVVEVFGPLEALEAFSARLRTEAPPPTAAIREIQSRAIPGEAFRSSSSFLARVGRERS